MNDEEKPNFERQVETQPEKSPRSVFDWLRGKGVTEQTEVEKLRKKIDEELKEAARKRATDFEEERRQEEKREVSETKKLKKRWRAKLFEKSLHVLDEAAERGDKPTSGYEVAKIMVAERIVKLHHMLNDETIDLRRSEMKTLKIHIDFMGLLSEKLDRPELEVPEEVEQLYQTIAMSVEETTGEPLPHAPTEQEVPELSEADNSYNQFASSIVKAIKRTLRRTEEKVQNIGDSADSVVTPNTEHLLAAVRKTALSAEAIRHEIFHETAIRQLAETTERVVSRPAMKPKMPETSVRNAIETVEKTSRTPVMKPGTIELLATSATISGVKRNKSVITTATQTEKPGGSSSEDLTPLPNKKVKFFTEVELLRLADRVDAGAGRLLSDVYKKGEIDREELVTVLDSYRKGLDYRRILTLKRATRRRLKANSPEYLSESSSTPRTPPAVQTTERPIGASRIYPEDLPTSPAEKTKETTVDTPPSPPPPPRKKPIQSTKGTLRNIGHLLKYPLVENNKAEISRIAREVKERVKRQDRVVVLLISVLLVIILALIVISLDLG